MTPAAAWRYPRRKKPAGPAPSSRPAISDQKQYLNLTQAALDTRTTCSDVVSPGPPWLSRHDRASAAISSGMNALCTPVAVVAPDLYSEFRDNFPLLPGNVW
jgi:hypothetical protein